jgi:glyoxylase-like metal-dependent hydrolase (beta-lactamase superfamily II)
MKGASAIDEASPGQAGPAYTVTDPAVPGEAAIAAAVGEADFRVRVMTRVEGAFQNTVVIETSGHVVVIDPGFSPNDATAVQALIDSVGKPLEAVLLTHAHIDHYGALYGLERGRAPVIASAGVVRQLAGYDSLNYARFGMRSPGARTWPDRLMGDGQSFAVDGVTFTMFDAGAGESYADVWWKIESGGRTAAVLGDLAMRGLPPLMQSGHSAEWLSSLERVALALPADARLYIGHDAEAPGKADPSWDTSILRWQARRITAFRNAVRSITGAGRLLTDAEIARVVSTMHADAPENLEAFDFLITTSANVLAAELILERQRQEFESILRAAVARMSSGDGGA